jgi:hypothetical protein
MLIHSVYFWFKADADPAVVARFEEGLRRLTAIPDIQSAHFGRPETTPKRPVIDDSYDWALVENFQDLAAHDRYQEHEILCRSGGVSGAGAHTRCTRRSPSGRPGRRDG